MGTKEEILKLVRGDETWLSVGERQLLQILKGEASAKDLGVTSDAIRHRSERLLKKHQRLFDRHVRLSELEGIVNGLIDVALQKAMSDKQERPALPPNESISVDWKTGRGRNFIEMVAYFRAMTFVVQFCPSDDGLKLWGWYATGDGDNRVKIDISMKESVIGKSPQQLLDTNVEWLHIPLT